MICFDAACPALCIVSTALGGPSPAQLGDISILSAYDIGSMLNIYVNLLQI